MASPFAHEAPPSAPFASRSTASSFTAAQVADITELVHEATAAAVNALRHELGRWHCYLALYLLAQIGIVLLAALLMTDPTPSRPMARNVEPAREISSAPPSGRSGTALECLDSPNLHRFAGHERIPQARRGFL